MLVGPWPSNIYKGLGSAGPHNSKERERSKRGEKHVASIGRQLILLSLSHIMVWPQGRGEYNSKYPLTTTGYSAAILPNILSFAYISLLLSPSLHSPTSKKSPRFSSSSFFFFYFLSLRRLLFEIRFDEVWKESEQSDRGDSS